MTPSKGARELPKISRHVAHPQSVWFEEHWRPRYDELKAELADCQVETELAYTVQGDLVREADEKYDELLAQAEALAGALQTRINAEKIGYKIGGVTISDDKIAGTKALSAYAAWKKGAGRE